MRPVVATLLAVALAGPVAAQETAEVRRIVVTGQARIDAAPDLATFSAGVQSEALQATEALGATAAAMRAVFGALQGAGVADEDIQTSQVSVDPLWDDAGDGRQAVVRGYAATNVVTVRVRDVGRLGALIDAVGAAGANRVSGIAFEVAEPRAQMDAARRDAVDDARAKADLLAQAAGVTLGPVLSIREGGGDSPPPMFARAEMAMDMPVAAGVVGIEARVEIVFGID